MTIIAAIQVAGEGVHYGADSRQSLGEMRFDGFTSKWRNVGEFFIGLAGFSRIDHLLHAHQIEIEECTSIWELADKLKELIDDDGWHDGDGDAADGPILRGVQMLVVYHGRLWIIESSLTPLKVPPGELVCLGSGSYFAHGAGHATRKKSAYHRVKAAIEAASALDCSCGGPAEIGIIYE